jgi:UDP-N-acetylglucosamine 2-epimerase (non-hydrolysing)
MPEEINRMVTDSITNYFFTTSEFANENLRNTGVSNDRIFFVGNTMIDTLLSNLQKLKPAAFWEANNLSEGEYIVTTLHRPANVDKSENLSLLLSFISKSARGRPIIFPVHPRTAKTLVQIGDLPENIIAVPPQPYLEFIHLIKNAKAIITDSGGITEEATVLKVPCMTLRDSTERPETVEVGTNELVGTKPSSIPPVLNRIFEGNWKDSSIPEKWDGQTGRRIVEHLASLIQQPNNQ